ncbi:LLM class flavin-dependent oxidoreductase [Paenibacillus arenilitoris]|uniref:LLM class flavin-dependent oxidoreductase n=1 Tax=Paenibacillus arenilitoris TaxID=2772299 RepID=A0A927H6H3_9BACL|nr:LLM class flavin-dependent oxidoreductase [Paenibacillus arenilitoris]MBD2870556.1 LLM class flavin-dependent oxidoreductase [Paenibacillus arenilitoris]
METAKRHMHLNLFLMNTGHHEASWRHPDTSPRRITELDYYCEIGRIAERGKLDSLFLADTYVLPVTVRHKVLHGLEPFTLLAAIAAVTSRIGLIGTASTTYNDPFHIARKFASLDHISGGRTGWNIVTTASESAAYNFGDRALPDHAQRYRRADEFVEVVKALWDSWEDGALVADKDSGVYADMDKIHPLAHKGAFFSVQGPLNVPRAPQGQPVLVQAGSSEDGKSFAAKVAEAVFTAQNDYRSGQAFYRDMKDRANRCGRSPDELRVLPGLYTVVGDTEAEAKELERELGELTVPAFGLQRLSTLFKVDLTGYPLDAPVPLELLPKADEINGNRGRYELIENMARREKLTIGQLIKRTAGSRGHAAAVGTPAQIADEMERWFKGEAADGFNLMPSHMPGGLADFVDKVIPELQNRGLFRSEYEGYTLRDHYGLPRPAGRGREGVRL